MRSVSAAAAVASRPGLHAELSIWGTPKRAAAFAAVAAPPGVNDSIEPIGASITGSRTGWPNHFPVASISATSRRTRGRNAIESRACRLRRSVVSLSVPPTR